MLPAMRALLLVGLLIGVVGIGCGGDKITSVTESKKLSELSGDDMKQLCEDMKVYKTKKKVSDEENIKISCNAQAVMTVAKSEAKDDAALRAECKKVLDACLAKKDKMPDATEIDCNDKKFSGEMSACDATVGELTECVNDMNGVLKKFATEDACGMLKVGDKDGLGAFFDRMKSPKCDAMETKCKAGKARADKSGGGGDALAQEALTKVDGFRDQMCACKDKDCATKVSDAMTKWGNEMASKVGKEKPEIAIAKKMGESVTKFTECMTKLMMDAAPAPAPAPAPPTP
jgi:hypothetical protein